jgi:monoamine oxidase
VSWLDKLFGRDPQSPAAEPRPDGAPPRADVIVIGAGMAGLACARKLGQQGKRVLILEGRPRLGGRIHSAPLQGVSVDLGASWIHGGKGNPIRDLARDAGARLVRTDYEALELFDIDGRPLKGREYKAIDRLWERTMQELLRAQRNAARDHSLEPIVRRAFDETGLSATEQRGVRWALTSEIACAYAAEFHDLSLSQWDEDEEYGGGDFQFAGGYSTLVDFLAGECTRLGVEIRTGAIVRSIDWSSREVRVRTGDGDYEAAQAVVTLPLGVLKRGAVQFAGTLPEEKRQAIRRLGFGTLNKVVMAFAKQFWPDEENYFGCLSETDETHIDFWNLEPVVGTPVLAALIGGDAAVRLEGLSDAEILRLVLDQLRPAFGTQEPLAVQITRWANDPFAYGTYSHVPPGATYDDYEALAEPIGNRVFFAGEATSVEYPSTVHGAYESGERAAKEILG